MDVNPLVPLVVGFLVALVTAPAGLSGAFLLLPFQMSVLGFVSPAVSSTNLVYNLVATPGGIARYWRDRKLDRALGLRIIAGTAPGVLIGAVLRITFFEDPHRFRVFVGVVLVALAVKLVLDVTLLRKLGHREASLTARSGRWVIAVSAVVGLIGGIYGIGGGAIIAPFLVAVLGLSVYRVAGAALVATFVTSVVGIIAFQLLAVVAHHDAVAPHWGLGLLFGIGGFAGSYVGASLQRRLPEYWIKVGLATAIGVLGLSNLLAGLRK